MTQEQSVTAAEQSKPKPAIPTFASDEAMGDTHVHLNDEAFGEDYAETLSRARQAGVKWMNLIGYDYASSCRAVELAREDAALFAVVGVHPHDAWTWSEDVAAGLRNLLQHAQENHIVAYGEIGLDYYYDHSPREKQKEVFWLQLQLAHAFNLPVVIHNRDAHADCLSILQRAADEGLLRTEAPGCIHCYSGSPEMAREFLRLGFYLGYDGPITFKNAKQPVACVEMTPLDRLLLETDCPYLTPAPYRGKRNEPAYLPFIAQKVAEIKHLSLEDVIKQTTLNAQTLFSWPKTPF